MSTFKRGETFDFSGPLTLTENGVRKLDLTGWNAYCQLRKPSGDLIESLVCTWVDATASLFRVSAAGSTAQWPVGPAVFDVRLVDPTGEIVVTTRTQRIEIERNESDVGA